MNRVRIGLSGIVSVSKIPLLSLEETAVELPQDINSMSHFHPEIFIYYSTSIAANARYGKRERVLITIKK